MTALPWERMWFVASCNGWEKHWAIFAILFVCFYG